jgi:hypothetical protein
MVSKFSQRRQLAHEIAVVLAQGDGEKDLAVLGKVAARRAGTDV